MFEANPNTVVVIVGGYPFAVNWEQEHVPSILFTSHAGQELGHAVADVLYGDYNPGGRLNMTWYKSTEQLPDLMDYDIIKGKRTYQYFDGEVLYPFGHGLSYARFHYSDLSLSQSEITAEGGVTVTVAVRNESQLAGDEVVQLYVKVGSSRVVRPLKTLKGFRRIHLAPGASETVSFELKAEDLAFWDVTRDRYCVEKVVIRSWPDRPPANCRKPQSFRSKGDDPSTHAREPVRAVNYDDYQGVFLDECREGGESIRLTGETGWIAFHDVDLGESSVTFQARVSGHIKGGEIVITTGARMVLRLEAQGSADRRAQAWTTVQAELTGLTGRSDVFLTMKGEVQISWFRIA